MVRLLDVLALNKGRRARKLGWSDVALAYSLAGVLVVVVAFAMANLGRVLREAMWLEFCMSLVAFLVVLPCVLSILDFKNTRVARRIRGRLIRLQRVLS